MAFDTRRAFLHALEEEAGAALRSVAVYDRAGYEFLTRDEDVDATYSQEMLDDIHRGMILEGLASDHLESMFDVGSLQCALYGFEDAYVFHFLGHEYDGLVVSVDAGAEIRVGSFVDVCKDGLDLLS